ncbi:hypothetical protein ABW20_dc0110504 [Dactylellina cionopaga]|nr:hypothetical protein ABW20_dc0110504 [Dactylellina cionopaga]
MVNVEFLKGLTKKVEQTGANLIATKDKVARDVHENAGRALNSLKNGARGSPYVKTVGSVMVDFGGLLSKTGGRLKGSAHEGSNPDGSGRSESPNELGFVELDTNQGESSEGDQEQQLEENVEHSIEVFEEHFHELDSNSTQDLETFNTNLGPGSDPLRIETSPDTVAELPYFIPKLPGDEIENIISIKAMPPACFNEEGLGQSLSGGVIINPISPTANQKSIHDNDPLLNRRFLSAAWKALKKLRCASKKDSASPQLKNFVGSFMGLNKIISTGLEAFQIILDGKVPSQLEDIYCFLHVAYALSRAERRAKDEDLPPAAFRQDLQIFRSCLSSLPDRPSQPSPRDIFDEIAEVMWKEFQQGLKWVKQRLPRVISANFDSLDPFEGLKVNMEFEIPTSTSKPVSRLKQAGSTYIQQNTKRITGTSKTINSISTGMALASFQPSTPAELLTVPITNQNIVSTSIFQDALNVIFSSI